MNETLILLISNALTGIGAWFVSRKRQEADTDNSVLKNLELAVNVYGKIVSDLKIEIEGLNLRIQELETKIQSLYAENHKLKSKVKE